MMNSNSKTIFAVCIVLIAMVAGTNQMVSRCSDVGKMLSEVREEMMPATGTAARGAKAAERKSGGVEVSDDGALRRAYKNLEQPAELSGTKEIILAKSQFIISYNTDNLCPNYVCWSLDANRVNGTVKRTNNFHADPELTGRGVVDKSDYNGSGYDRGHMCPAGDNKNSEAGMDDSFCMTNICPQHQNLNRGAWNELEQLCRNWACDYGTVYICCGPIFDSVNPRKIGSRRSVKIAVPDRFFKVVLYLGRVSKAIGFIYPNKACEGDIRDYAVSVDAVEEATGMDFFFQLDDELEDELERECNPGAWGI